MSQLLEKLRLYWWERAYKKIWEESLYKEKITFSTETEDGCSRLVSFIYNNLQPEKRKVVLDVGCGNGNLGERVFKDCDLLIQTDYSFEALKLIKNSENPLKRYVLQSDAGLLPFKENTFDYILLYSVIHNSGSLENARRWISSAVHLLKNGGRLYIGDVPIKKRLYQELKHRTKKVRSLNDIKYFFAELMQISFSIDDFIDIEGAAQLKIIQQPLYIKFSKWRVDIEIQKKAK